ncbi:type IV pilus modification protein PilV [Undibacterium griseum]|uniref:Type IV pilus modification protein PilV n=1 Tax=Undibacterium griseum TaxID=2762295 RepID=A0ABR6YJE0_9BURK|nr:type IV pilus modification protein PilV [Undibacterium griseum]MBC3884017.1 type IV pilus modification protein PilV [Undibacterium griseum]
MNLYQKTRPLQAGYSMIEVLVTLVILMLGLLGLVGLMLLSQRSEMESYQRAQALVLLQDLAGRINANRTAAPCYAITTDTVNGTPYLGVSSSVTPSCSSGSVEAYTLANNDLTAWNNLLTGTAEQSGTANLGAMIGARGCISFDSASGTYLVSIAWQGNGKTAAPGSGLSCGKGLYGDETMRRVVSMPLQIANLN